MISKGNHVNFARFVLLAVSEEAETRLPSFCVRSMCNKTIIGFGFCDIQNNQGLGKGYQPKPKASTLIILDITKTLSNNCLLTAFLPLFRNRTHPFEHRTHSFDVAFSPRATRHSYQAGPWHEKKVALKTQFHWAAFNTVTLPQATAS